jgi:hypothetical protein
MSRLVRGSTMRKAAVFAMVLLCVVLNLDAPAVHINIICGPGFSSNPPNKNYRALANAAARFERLDGGTVDVYAMFSETSLDTESGRNVPFPPSELAYCIFDFIDRSSRYAVGLRNATAGDVELRIPLAACNDWEFSSAPKYSLGQSTTLDPIACPSAARAREERSEQRWDRNCSLWEGSAVKMTLGHQGVKCGRPFWHGSAGEAVGECGK